MIGYVYIAGEEVAVIKVRAPHLLPRPKIKAADWMPLLQLQDVYAGGLVGFDRKVFDRQGYQVLPRLRILPPD